MHYIELTINRLHKILIDELKEKQGVHAETALATFGAIIGVHLGLDVIKENNYKFGKQKKSQALLDIKGKSLMNNILRTLKPLEIDNSKLLNEIASDHDHAILYLLDVTSLHETYMKVMNKINIAEVERSSILVLGLYKLIKLTESTLDKQIAASIAIQQIVKFSNETIREI